MVRTAGKVNRFNALRKQSIDDETILYEVEAIVDKKIVNGRTYYLVKWLGYDSSENTWERRSRLSLCKHSILQFELTRKEASSNAKTRRKH